MRRVGSLLHVGRSRTGPSHLAHRDRAVPHATASSAAPSRYPFSAEDITFAARWLASVDSGGAASADSAGMARQHGWDLLEGRKLPASDFWPFLFRRGKKLLLTFHGTNLQHWRQAASAARLGLGFVPHVAFLEAAQWTSAVVHAHRPESVVLSGHSMGGALAEMLSVYFTSPRHARLLGEVELGAVTFDSPSFPLQHFLQTVMVDSAAHAEDAILQYKGAPTLVNTCHPPVGGEVRRVMIPHIEDVHHCGLSLLRDALDFGADCTLWLREPAGTQALSKAVLTKAYDRARMGIEWSLRQHSVELLSEHLSEQYRVQSWPTQSQVVLANLACFAGIWSFKDTPVAGPACALKAKLWDDHWVEDMSHVRGSIEVAVQQTPGYSQCTSRLPPQEWDMIAAGSPFPQLASAT